MPSKGWASACSAVYSQRIILVRAESGGAGKATEGASKRRHAQFPPSSVMGSNSIAGPRWNVTEFTPSTVSIMLAQST